MIAVILTAIFAVFEWIEGPPKPPQQKPPPTPQEMNITRACLSSGLLAGCAYLPFFAAALLGKGPGALVAEFLRTPAEPPAALVVWAAAVVIGTVYLVVGLRGACDGPHAGLWAFWSAALPIVGGVVLWLHAPALLSNPVVIVGAVMCAMRFWIAIRRDTALRAVRRNIKRKNAPLRAARRRWWQWW